MRSYDASVWQWRSRVIEALPPPVAARLRALRGLPAAGRRRFIVPWLLGRLGADRPAPTSHAPCVLFVCHGNIIRSALAEVLARRAAREAIVDISALSAGLNAIEGRPADPRAVAVARELGLSLTRHKARPVTADTVEYADFVVVMDHSNEASIVSRFPAAARRVHLLLGPGIELTDPYPGTLDDVRLAAATIDLGVRRLVRRIGRIQDERVSGESLQTTRSPRLRS